MFSKKGKYLFFYGTREEGGKSLRSARKKKKRGGNTHSVAEKKGYCPPNLIS